MVLSHLTVAKITYYYIIIVMRTALHSFTVRNAKGGIISIRRYLIIKRIMFLFREKFATTNSKRRY